MMKRIIQVCSMLVLTVVFFAVTANAQTSSRINAKIPFNFTVGEKAYNAGDYVIQVSRVSVSTSSITLQDDMGKILQSFLVLSNGESASGAEHLVFDNHSLSKIITKNKGLSLSALNSSSMPKRETVAAR